MRSGDWIAIWYKCLVCHRCFNNPDRLVLHKNETDCGNIYKNHLVRYLSRSERNYSTGATTEITKYLQSAIATNFSELNKAIEIKQECESVTTTSSITAAKSLMDDTNLKSPQAKIIPGTTKDSNGKPKTLQIPVQSKPHVEAIQNNSPKTVSKFKPIYKKCYFCDKKLRSLLGMVTHLTRHTSEKPYRCMFCRTICANNDARRRHIQKFHAVQNQSETVNTSKSIHTSNPTQFSVDIKIEISPKVNQGLKRKKQLQLQPSVGIKKRTFYACFFCNKKLTRPSHLVSHMVQHTKEQAYRCKSCRNTFSNAQSLKTHIRKSHGLQLSSLINRRPDMTPRDGKNLKQ